MLVYPNKFQKLNDRIKTKEKQKLKSQEWKTFSGGTVPQTMMTYIDILTALIVLVTFYEGKYFDVMWELAE